MDSFNYDDLTDDQKVRYNTVFEIIKSAMRGCGDCANYNWGSLGSTCKAYPSGIPTPILNGELYHLVSVPGDKNIIFTPRAFTKNEAQYILTGHAYQYT